MKHSTYLIMNAVYIYAQLLGTLNFCYNCRTGKACVKVYNTIYSAIINLLMFAALIYFLLNMELKIRPPGRAELYYKLNLLTTVIRIAGVIITIFNNLTKRNDVVALSNSYRDFCEKFLQRFQMENKYFSYLEQGIRQKLVRSLAANVIMFVVTWHNIKKIFDMENPYILFALTLISTVLNVAMTLYHFAILNMNTIMIVINHELKRILNASNSVCQIEPAIAKRLADETYLLSMAQYKVTQYFKSFNKMFKIQGVCVMLDLYITNICVIYMFCMMSEHYEMWLSFGKWTIYLVPIAIFIYYCDLKLFIFALLNSLDLMEQTAELLKEHETWLSKRGELERNIENFSLQLALFPFEMDLTGLFKMNRALVFIIFSSTISNAIVLIQYDLKYTKKQ